MRAKKIESDLEELFNEKDELRNVDDMNIYWNYIIKKIDTDLKEKGLNRIEYLPAIKRIFLDQSFRKRKNIANFRSVVRCRARMQNIEGKFIPDSKIKESRQNKEEEYRKYITGNEADLS